MAVPEASVKGLVFPVELEGSREVNDKTLNLYYHHIEDGERGGYFPVGVNTLWHGGVHLHVPEGSDVYSCLPGRIVGVRLAENMELVKGYYGYRNFILVKHERREGSFYSLYMHLNPIPLSTDDTFIKQLKWTNSVWYRFKTERNYRRTPSAKGNAPLGAFKPGDEVELVENADKAPWKKVRLSNGGEVYVSIRPHVATVCRKPNEKLLEQLKSGAVVSLNTPVLADELLWQSGKAGKGNKQDGILHWEIFSAKNLFAPQPDSHGADSGSTDGSDGINWEAVEDPDDNYNMDCKNVLKLFEKSQARWESKEKLTADELKAFYKNNPNAFKLRTFACKFVSEWGIPDLDKAIKESRMGRVNDQTKENIQKYQWWGDAYHAGVDLQDSAHCWHYHPVSVLWALRPHTEKPALRLGIFFDGTNNDKKNNDSYSNVAKLSYVYNEDDKTVFAHYIRGVGPDIPGAAFGAGADDRINGMLFDIQGSLGSYFDYHNDLPDRIILDVFGFSRGAAMARHFVNVIKQGGYVFDPPFDGLKPDVFHIHFVGVFDTVGSFGKPGDNDDGNKTFAIDPEWVEGRVVHLVADDEYRENFDVQTLFSKQEQVPHNLEQGCFHEWIVPGAHADVGGGYGSGEDHKRTGNALSRIYLHRMHKEARDSGVPFMPISHEFIEKNEKHWKIDREVEELYEKLMGYYKSKPDLQKEHKLLKEWELGLKHAQDTLTHMQKHKRRGNRTHGTTSNMAQIERQRKKVSQMTQHKHTQQRKVEGCFDSPREAEAFLATYKELYDNYIHISHSLTYTTPGMGPQIQDDGTFQREVFYKPVVDWKKDIDTEYEAVEFDD